MKSASGSSLSTVADSHSLRVAVVEHLRREIIAGALPPGARITESGLVAELGVSATPVREALVELAGEGLVDGQPNRVRRVAPMDRAGIAQLVRVQGMLWRTGYEWAMPLLGLGELGELSRAIDDYARSLEAGEHLGAIQAGQRFHSIVIAASGNRELLRVTLDRRSLLARFILLRGSETVSRSGLAQHRAILAALRNGAHNEALAKLDRLIDRLTLLAASADFPTSASV